MDLYTRMRRAIDGAVSSARAVALSALGLSAFAPAPRAARSASAQSAGTPRGSLSSRAQPQVPVVDDWDVEDVRAALREHEDGVFTRSALLADAMGRQDRISGVMGTRVAAVLSMPHAVRAAARGDDAVAAAALLAPRYARMVSRATRAAVTRWLVFMGFVVCRRVWTRDRRTGLWDVRLQPWHPTWVRYDHGRDVYLVTTTTGVEECPADGSSADWCVMFLLDEERPWMQGAIRALALAFLILGWAYRDWARWSEKHGLPPLKAKVPTAERFKQLTAQFLEDLQALATEPTILLPEGFDLEWAELKNWQSYQGFQELARRQETNVAIVLLGQNLTTEVTGGSFAATRAHELVRRDHLTGTAQAVDAGERFAVALPWTRVNVTDDALLADEIAPHPTTDTTPPIDVKERVANLATLGQAIRALQEAGVSVDALALAREHDVPLAAALPRTTERIEPWHIEQGVATRNEARAQLGLGPLSEGAGARPTPKVPGAPAAASPPAPGALSPPETGSP